MRYLRTHYLSLESPPHSAKFLQPFSLPTPTGQIFLESLWPKWDTTLPAPQITKELHHISAVACSVSEFFTSSEFADYYTPQDELSCTNQSFPSYVSGVFYSYLITKFFIYPFSVASDFFQDISSICQDCSTFPSCLLSIAAASPSLVIHVIKKHMPSLSCK